jgi:hypothetical protein
MKPRSIWHSPIRAYVGLFHTPLPGGGVRKGLYKPVHGPQTWPWWRLLSLSLSRLDTHAHAPTYRMWAYTRWGALFVDVTMDRRVWMPDAKQWQR